MILVDTSVWIDHFREADERMADLLRAETVASHPFVIGEIALGSIKGRANILTFMCGLPQVASAQDNEVMALIEQRSLYSRGIGWVDAHLIASALLSGGCQIFTHDRRLGNVCEEFGVGFDG